MKPGYSRMLHPPHRALRTAFLAALAAAAIIIPAALLLGLLS